jgi:integrase
MAHQEQGHLPPVGQSRPEGQGDSLPDLEDGHRCPRPGRAGHPSGRHSEQGPVRSSNPPERGAKDRTSRVCRNDLDADQHLLDPERRSRGMSPQAIVNLFWRWYRHVGFDGCSSHSGRRTFITNTARKISTVGGSLRDVQMLAGHTNLRTTQRYIEANPEAQVRIVELV